MISGISGAGAYYSAYRPYTASAARSVRTEQAENTQNAHKAAGLWTSRRSAGPDVPVEPVRPVTAVDPRQTQPHVLSIREGADPVEMAVRMRIEYLPQDAGQTAAQEGVLPEGRGRPRRGKRPAGGGRGQVRDLRGAQISGWLRRYGRILPDAHPH